MPRKGLYEEWTTEEALTQVRGWARDGLTDKEIAENIGITTTTLYDWKNKFPVFSDAIKNGRAPVNIKLEDSMFSRCEWRQVTDTKEEIYKSSDGKETKKITRMTHWIPPDTGMMIFMAKNRMSSKYSDRPRQNRVFAEEETDAISAALEALSNGGVEP